MSQAELPDQDQPQPQPVLSARGPAWDAIKTALRDERDGVLSFMEATHHLFLQKLEREWLELNLRYLEEHGATVDEPFAFVQKWNIHGVNEPNMEVAPPSLPVVANSLTAKNLQGLREEAQQVRSNGTSNHDIIDVSEEPAAARGAARESEREFSVKFKDDVQEADEPPAKDDEEQPEVDADGRPIWMQNLHTWVHSTQWEVTFGVLIMMNTIAMIFEIQYAGLNYGHQIGVKGINQSGEEMWPGASEVFEALDFLFGLAFTVEITGKIITENRKFLLNLSNWYDLAIVSLFWLKAGVQLEQLFSPFLLRLVRVTRLLRLLKFVRAFEVFDTLRLLVRSIRACLPTMFWTGILVLTIIMVFAMFFCFILEADQRDETIDLDLRLELFDLFGTFDRSVLSIHEVTFGNWVPISRFLSKNFSRYHAYFFLAYRCVISFGILLVVRSVFVAETIRCAQTDDEIMILQKERQVRVNSQRMQRFFAEADDSGDGLVSLEEFRQILANKRVQTWLAAQDLHISDPAFVFQLVDSDGTDCLSAVELAHGLSRLKGPAKAMDLMSMSVDVKKMNSRLHELLVAADLQRSQTTEVFRLQAEEFNAEFGDALQREPDFTVAAAA
eukprot:TRINITY_DN90473_c0_g1_i1.p1 TRINITY_DN90473_c0_g1~~TRINITY_DN90473_c0_g1_i1.p1  ORF type:complete len:614 (-),score=97.32 TRINITY_DN90473_c0_g1_i1:240-2081(-)